VGASPYDNIIATAIQQWNLFTTQQALAAGLTRAVLERQARVSGGPFDRMARGIYGLREFPAHPLQLLGVALLGHGAGAVACGRSAAWALGLDGVSPGCIEVALPPGRGHYRTGVRRRELTPAEVVRLGPFWMTAPVITLLDIAADLDDIAWEWSLESAMRRGLVTMSAVWAELDERARLHQRGVARARRVLELRPTGARPTGSQLETEFIQLIRPVPEIPDEERQFPVERNGEVVARLDVAFPRVHAYTEVHGAQHRESLVYDACRETMVAATLGWLESEVTSRDIRYNRRATIGRMVEFIHMASRRVLVTRD
jgi:hypothetical protein